MSNCASCCLFWICFCPADCNSPGEIPKAFPPNLNLQTNTPTAGLMPEDSFCGWSLILNKSGVCLLWDFTDDALKEKVDHLGFVAVAEYTM